MVSSNHEVLLASEGKCVFPSTGLDAHPSLVQRMTRLVGGRGHASLTCGDGLQAYHLVLYSHSENQVVN